MILILPTYDDVSIDTLKILLYHVSILFPVSQSGYIHGTEISIPSLYLDIIYWIDVLIDWIIDSMKEDMCSKPVLMCR